jgi:hypothetical protein
VTTLIRSGTNGRYSDTATRNIESILKLEKEDQEELSPYHRVSHAIGWFVGTVYFVVREMLGFKGIFVDTPDLLASAWQQAPSSHRPVVLEVKTDPDVVPLPPHVTLKQARGFMSSMIKGDRGAGHIIGETAKQVVDGLFGKGT